MNRICIYAASSPLIPDQYKEQSAVLTKHLVKQGFEFIYGGGSTGLMGVVADTVLAEGGKITGVIPQFMKELEWNHPGVEDMIFTDTMAERKQLFLEGSDIIITLPGGCGTLEEITEAYTLKQLGKINHTLLLANFNGFYDSLIDQFDKMIELHCIRAEHRSLWSVFHDLESFDNAFRESEKQQIVQQKSSKL